MASEQPMGMAMAGQMNGVGHLYMQTNELRNSVVHYRRSPNGGIEEIERVSTGGAGSGEFKPTSGQESAPNAFEGAASVILSPDRRLLFATNGGDNSVSSFAVGEGGRLTLVDVCSTGNPVEPEVLRLERNGWMPNNPHLPVLLYRAAFPARSQDRAACLGVLLARLCHARADCALGPSVASHVSSFDGQTPRPWPNRR